MSSEEHDGRRRHGGNNPRGLNQYTSGSSHARRRPSTRSRSASRSSSRVRRVGRPSGSKRNLRSTVASVLSRRRSTLSRKPSSHCRGLGCSSLATRRRVSKLGGKAHRGVSRGSKKGSTGKSKPKSKSKSKSKRSSRSKYNY
jgi:hypothetical protein